MASPFSIFRKNQKLMMAVLCIGAMFIFVIGDAIDIGGGARQASGEQDPVVATTKYFDLLESTLERAAADRNIVRQFLLQAQIMMVRKDAERELRQQLQGEQLRAMGEEAFNRRVEMQTMFMVPQIQQLVDRLVGTMDERDIVESLILAEQARQLGIQASDQRVLDFINNVTGNQLTAEQLTSIYERLGGGGKGRLTKQQLYDAFRGEMLAGDMRRWFVHGPTQATTPLDRWQYYLRKNCFANAEVLAVSAQEVLGEVAEPSDAEITALFEEHKYTIPVPGSPDPGFKLPQQAAFQYFTASEATFFEPDKIPADEVAKYYEENKGRYPYSGEAFDPREPTRVTPDFDFAEPSPAAASGAAASTPAGPSPSTPTPATPSPTTPSPTAAAAATRSAATPTPTKPAAPASNSSPSPSPSPSPSKPQGSCDPSSADDSSSDEGRGEEDSSACQPPAGDAKPTGSPTASATPSPSATPTGSAKPTASASPSVVAPALGNPGTVAASPTASPSATPIASPSATPMASPTGTAAAVPIPQAPPPLPSDDVLLPVDIKSGKTPEFDPLWKIEKKVRAEMARTKAREKVEEIFKKIKGELSEATLNRLDVESDAPLYTPEQWLEFAKQHGVTGDTTPLMSELEVGQLAEQPGLFHANVLMDFRSMERQRQVGVVAFETAATYNPVEALEIPEAADFSRENPGQTIHYLFWKTKHVNARVPELTEPATREAVVTALKMRQARELVRKKAEALATEARQANQPLAKTFAGRDVRNTGTFTWFEPDLSGDFRQQMQQPELKLTDRVVGVDDPGPDFFRAAFGLRPGEVGTAMNNPETVCYVIRLVRLSPSREQLQAQFLLDHYQNYERYGRRDVQFEEGPETNAALVAAADLKWLREPRNRER